VDIQAVVDYLKATYGYVIELLVGHSRGSIVAFRWLATTEDGRKVSAFVNASGRYRMAVRVQSHFFHVIEAELRLRKFLVRKAFKGTSGWLLTMCQPLYLRIPCWDPLEGGLR